MDVGKIIGQNIAQVLEDNNASIEGVANILGVTRQTFAKYIKGESVIDSGKLFKLSRYFNKPMRYFVLENHDEMSFMYRADNPLDNFDDCTREFITKKFNELYEVYKLSRINTIVMIPEEYKIRFSGNKISDEEKEYIRQIADKQRILLRIEDEPEVDLYSVLEKNNINVVSFPLNNDRIDAVSAYSKDKGAFIFVNDDDSIPEERKLFSLIHEYGHLLMHRDMYSFDREELSYSSSRSEISEKAANLFASYFLMPREVLEQEMKTFMGFIDLKGIFRLKKKFGVSAKALLTALLEGKYISGAVYGSFVKRLNNMGYEFKEPEPLNYIDKNQRLFYLLKSLYLKGMITTNKISEILGLNLQQGRNLIKEWSEDELDED